MRVNPGEPASPGSDENPASVGEEPEEDDLDIDLFNDLVVSASQSKGLKDSDCEDRVLSKFKLPLEYMSSSASCVMLGVLDGHGGSTCVDYITKQLPVSLLSVIRNPMKRKMSDSENLINVIKKAFQTTDHNFLHMAKRMGGDNSGSTIACATFFGPDSSDGQLRVLLGSLGDSRAVLYKLSSTGVDVHASSPIHKPSSKSETRRISAEGGQVSRIQGIDRVVKRIANATGISTVGLSVSRAFGDLVMKQPKPVVSAVPEFTEAVIDFDADQFLVIGSDGVFDYITEIEVGSIVSKSGRSRENMQTTADDIVALAKARGSTDDRTCVIVDFSWAHRNINN
jgi:serine/threonine protein phosphatase PrpC